MLEHIFPGSSEMSRRMREHDWSRTPLGPVESWPPALRTSVSTCLDCAFPIVLWWGPELVILYNDEYRPALGPKHPAALGEGGARVWAEIWDVIGPMLAQVMTRGEATRSRDLLLHIDRGYLEEAYFSFSYSPIHDETGGVAGVFCPVIETTDKVIGERRLRTLRDIAARCKGAKSEESACEAAATILASNPHDVPFAMIYSVDERRSAAVLKAVAGVEPGTASAPYLVMLEPDSAGAWSLGTVAHTGRAAIVTDLAAQFETLPTGAWKIPPKNALALPVLLPGQEYPRTILVVAISPMRALDEAYRTFFGLVATQLAAGLADAQALEVERQRVEALAELDRAKTAFFSNVSHEFRTPLTLMLGPLEDLVADGSRGLPDDVAAALSVTHRNSLRLLKLVNTLLDFSRIEAGRIEASYEPVDLAVYTAELASVFRSAIEKAGLTLTVECDPLPRPVYVDRDMWEKTVLNLLSNALKFTLEGGVTIALRWCGDHIELSVADTGIGIAESDLPRMFERFHRIKTATARTHEGTGIGLALVQELAKLHGDGVSVTSEPGRGSTFVVSIPTGTSHLPPERIAAPREMTTTGAGATAYVEEALRWLPRPDAGAVSVANLAGPAVPSAAAAARILLADDNADMREYVRRLLEQRYQVEAVADGQAALDRIREEPPDLVLADVMMPHLDGFGLLAGIRGVARTRSIPVILVSARAGEEARIEGLDAGADEYLVKPFNARELLARVASTLTLARLRREAEQTIAESERQLREADRRKDEFLALLAHELRNPLAPIRTGLELIRLTGDSPDAVRRVRSVMERQVGHMVRLIDDLLDVSRITSGKIVLQRTPSALAGLVQSAVDAQRAAIAEAGLELTVRLPDAPCVVDVDPTRFVQVLSNVLHNASKFTPPPGSIRVECEIRSVDGAAAEEIVLSVTDTGIGISPEHLSRIFELFAQGEQLSNRSQGGLGIGLGLARRLIEMHGGRIDAKSEGRGTGTTIIIHLPLSEAMAATPPAPRGEVREIRSRVVIVDDNRDAAETMSMLVQELGGSARTAHDALTGLKAIAEFQPDVVFLDIGMPGIDGYEACRRIRREASGRSIVIVAVTGWGQAQDKQRAREAGFDAHLTKPVDPATFEALLVETDAARDHVG